eukprot:Sspe_Gene.60387::Locus_33282_Transcript_1_1_Confidence_1.000_Length_1313::g.60387::m.60387
MVSLDYSIEHKLRSVFTAVDRSEKGYVLLGDLHELLARIGLPWEYRTVQMWFNVINTKGNGRLTYPQWARFGREHPGLVDVMFNKAREEPLDISQITRGRGEASYVRHSSPGSLWGNLGGSKGYILRGDIRSALQRAGLPWDRDLAGALFDAADADGSGHITWSEWLRFAEENPKVLAALSAVQPGHTSPSFRNVTSGTPPPPPASVISSAWTVVSKGAPTARYADVRDAVAAAGLPWDTASVGEVFHAADKNKDGHVTWEEWWALAHSHPHLVTRIAEASPPPPPPPP